MEEAQLGIPELEHQMRFLWEIGKGTMIDEIRDTVRKDLLAWLEVPTETPVDARVIDSVALLLCPTLSRTHRKYQALVRKQLKGHTETLQLLDQIHNTCIQAWKYVVHVGIGMDTIIPKQGVRRPLGTRGLYLLGEGFIRIPEDDWCDACNGSRQERIPNELLTEGSLGEYVGWNADVLLAIHQLDSYQSQSFRQARGDIAARANDTETIARMALEVLIAPWLD